MPPPIAGSFAVRIPMGQADGRVRQYTSLRPRKLQLLPLLRVAPHAKNWLFASGYPRSGTRVGATRVRAFQSDYCCARTFLAFLWLVLNYKSNTYGRGDWVSRLTRATAAVPPETCYASSNYSIIPMDIAIDWISRLCGPIFCRLCGVSRLFARPLCYGWRPLH